MPVKTDNRVTEIKRLVRKGVTLRDIGEQLGLSGQRIHQILDAADPSFLPREVEKRRQKEAVRRQREDDAKRKEKERDRGNCRICDEKIPAGRASKYTCKPEHQEIWKRLRFHIDPQQALKHRESAAKTILNPDSTINYSDAQINWAKAVLSDNPPKLDRPTFASKDPDGPGAMYEAWKAEFPEMAAASSKAWEEFK